MAHQNIKPPLRFVSALRGYDRACDRHDHQYRACVEYQQPVKFVRIHLHTSLFPAKTYLETRSSRQATSELHESTANLVPNGRLALLVMNMARAAGEETTATRARSSSGGVGVTMLLS